MTTISINKSAIYELLKTANFMVFDLKRDNEWIIMNFQQVCDGLKMLGHIKDGDELELGVLFYQASEIASPIQFEDLAGEPDFAIQMF